MVGSIIQEWLEVDLADRKALQDVTLEVDCRVVVLLLGVARRARMIVAVSAVLDRHDDVLLLDVLVLAELAETLMLR